MDFINKYTKEELAQEINRIANCANDDLVVIFTNTHGVNSNGESDGEIDSNIYFGGFTRNECVSALNTLKYRLKASIYEVIEVTPCIVAVYPEEFVDFDPSSVDAEDFLSNYIEEHLDEIDNYGTDSDRFTIEYDYKPIMGDIFIKWSWQQHLGYARKFYAVCRCDENSMTELYYKDDGKVGSVMASQLVSNEEIGGINTKAELVDLIKRRVKVMDRWRSLENLDLSIRDMFETDYCTGIMNPLPTE